MTNLADETDSMQTPLVRNTDGFGADPVLPPRLLVATQSTSRLLDRDATFHQSRGHWGVQRLGRRQRRRNLVKTVWEDWFHTLAYRPTLQLMGIIFFTYTLIVFLFAFIYLGVSLLGAKITVYPDGSTKDSFCGMDITNHMEALYFSLSTMTTIGYGVSDYYFGDCWTPLLLVLWQSCCAITFQSIAIGLIFQRISRGQKRSRTVIFSDKAVVRRVQGVPYLLFRIGELRRQHLIEVNVRCYCLKHERYLRNAEQNEVETAYFLTRHLKLQYPDESLGSQILMSLPQVLVHRMDSDSPLFPSKDTWYDQNGRQRKTSSDSDSLEAYLRDRHAEIIVQVEGTDELTGQALQARHSYRWNDLAWDHTFIPCVGPWAEAALPDATCLDNRRCERRTGEPVCTVDFSRFHEIVPAEDAEDCPYVSL